MESDSRVTTPDTSLGLLQAVLARVVWSGGGIKFSWVYRITVNTAYMKLRSKKKEKSISLEELYPSFSGAGFQQEKIQDWSEHTESLLFANETREIIQKAVDLLPDKEKVVFLLRDVEGLSTEEVSEVLDLTIPAVKSRLHRARLFLRKKLSHYFEEYKVR